MDYHSVHITIIVALIVTILIMVAHGVETKMTTCRLASQLIVNKQRVCLFLGANNTQYSEYMPYDAGECPRQYKCPYRPNEKPFNLKNVIKSIKDQFK